MLQTEMANLVLHGCQPFRWSGLFQPGDVRRGLFFCPQKMHRSVTTKILLPDMFLRCDTK